MNEKLLSIHAMLYIDANNDAEAEAAGFSVLRGVTAFAVFALPDKQPSYYVNLFYPARYAELDEPDTIFQTNIERFLMLENGWKDWESHLGNGYIPFVHQRHILELKRDNLTYHEILELHKRELSLILPGEQGWQILWTLAHGERPAMAARDQIALEVTA